MSRGLSCRAAEGELAAVTSERDGLLPQLEEARWRGRQAERAAAEARSAAAEAQQVPTAGLTYACCRLAWLS